MTALKYSVLPLLTVCLMTSIARASSLCGDDAIAQADTAWQQEQQRYGSGMSSQYTVFMFEKALLELKICKNASDYDSLKALASNTKERLAIVATAYSNGFASKEDVDLVASEKEMRSQACVQIVLKSVEQSYSVGLATGAEVDEVRQTCALLGGK